MIFKCESHLKFGLTIGNKLYTLDFNDSSNRMDAWAIIALEEKNSSLNRIYLSLVYSATGYLPHSFPYRITHAALPLALVSLRHFRLVCSDLVLFRWQEASRSERKTLALILLPIFPPM